MIINRKRGFIYLAVPRTGSRAVSNLLHEWFPETVRCGHHRMDVPPEYRGMFIFTVVRNPYARILSYYRHRKRTESKLAEYSFRNYVEATVNETFPSIGLNNDRCCVDYPNIEYRCEMYRLEDINSWWPRLPIWNKNGAPDVPVANQSYKRFGGEFSEELANVVFDYFKQDFDRFNYDKNSWNKVEVSI